MSATQLKFDLVKLVVDSDDEDLLEFVRSLFLKAGEKADWWATISEAERSAILEGRRQMAEGLGIPHEAVREKVDALFEKLAGR